MSDPTADQIEAAFQEFTRKTERRRRCINQSMMEIAVGTYTGPKSEPSPRPSAPVVIPILPRMKHHYDQVPD